MASNKGSRLLDLPAELRLKIYERFFEDYKVRLPHYGRTRLSAPSLLLASKQVSHEAVDIYYAAATFVYVYPGHHTISDALSHLPRFRWPHVEHIAVDCTESCKRFFGTASAVELAEFHEGVCALYQGKIESIGARKAVVRMECEGSMMGF